MNAPGRARRWVDNTRRKLTPTVAGWQGAALALYLFALLTAIAFFTVFVLQDFAWQKLPAFVVRIGTPILLGFAALATLAIVNRLPLVYRLPLFVFAPMAMLEITTGDDEESAVFAAVILLALSFIGGGIGVLQSAAWRPRQQFAALTVLGLGVLAAAVTFAAVFAPKDAANPLLDSYRADNRTLALPNPGLAGPYAVERLSYGSGNDRHRKAFAEDAGLVSRSVDGSRLIDNWDGITGWLRSSYWGFDASALPLQARVWYPAGTGPFPLVLVVHGNHGMEDFSDPGYAYLGELFASRGIILASVDENFLNSSLSSNVNPWSNRPGLQEENDLRGWLLLEHLRLWRDWNLKPGNPFHRKVDIERVALIGHSRGGEAVGIAAAFNQLERYPDDASVEFDFGFNLRGVIAIAPVYGQYKPRGRFTPISDINYFTIHGDMDGDVQSFEGMAQYSRVTFSDDPFRFRAGLYVLGANHGQFNTTWQNLDTSQFDAWTLDLAGIMDGEAQRDVARVYFSAFLEVVLHDRYEYLPIFRDARYAAEWLPDTFYLNQFSTSRDTTLADFEEDIDPATMSVAGGRIETAHLSKWYEVANELKYDDPDTHGAVYAWNRDYSDDIARLDFVFPPQDASLDGLIAVSLADAGVASLPDSHELPIRETTEKAAAAAPLDWTVELTDAAGVRVALPLSHDAPLYPRVKALPHRADFLDNADPSETLFRHFEFAVADFTAQDTAFNPAALVRLSFIFDRSTSGAIIMDDLTLAIPQTPEEGASDVIADN